MVGFIIVFLAITSFAIHNVGAKSNYKICVPSQFLSSCNEMLDVETKSKAILECVPARDRQECLSYVQQRLADFVPVDPEDMYVALRIPNQDFVLFQEYRTDEEPDAEFRYQAVMVVRKDLNVTSVSQLKGLKSCHTGINRNVGYKIPLTKLMKLKEFPEMNDQSISPKENELKALSTFFSKSCIVGDWSPDPKTNAVWKSKYKSLCALCENPEICDYPDKFSGYEGAIRCVAENGGDVAFTKVIYVRKFFGLPVGTTPASKPSANPDDFAYLCADGTKVPITGPACSWAARPWQGLMGHQDILAKITPLREKLKQLADVGSRTKAKWFSDVLGLSAKIHLVVDNKPIKPAEYLDKADYTEVIERGHGVPEPVVRLCVTSNVELAKCRAMSLFAFSRDIRPRLDCVQEASKLMCLKSVRDNGSDLVADEDISAISHSKEYNLHPVIHEVYGPTKSPNYAVAVVKKDTEYMNIEDLRGKRSCHDSSSTFAGLRAPVYYLIDKKLIPAAEENNECIKNLSEYFSGGLCLPDLVLRREPMVADQLHSQCSSEDNALICLKENRGDVAFVSTEEIRNLDASQYELLCLNREHGGRDSLTNFTSCNIAMDFGRIWLSSKYTLSDESIAHTMLSLAELLDERKDLFNIYGEFLKNDNVIFHKTATGLATTDNKDFEKFIAVNNIALDVCRAA